MKLFVFNPENDLALANNQWNFIAPASARKMRADLEALPIWWTSDEDVVFVSAMPQHDIYHFLGLQQRFSTSPEVTDGMDLQPWGWSPLMRSQLQRAGVSVLFLPSDQLLAQWRHFSGRGFAVHVLQQLRGLASSDDKWSACLCGRSFLCTSTQQIDALLHQYSRTILKAPWSGSGKGLRLGLPQLQPPLTGWCSRLIREQGGVVVEPLYNKVYDFACEFYSDGLGHVSYKGLSLFTTTHQGIYSGNRVMSELEKEAILSQWISLSLLEWVQQELIHIFSSAFGRIYKGALGVDMMVCSDEGHYLLHPCVEINLRMTMGMVAQHLKRWVADGVHARFYIDYCAQPGTLYHTMQAETKTKAPQIIQGKLVKGLLPLTPVTMETTYRACLEVE